MRVCIITDNKYLLEGIQSIDKESNMRTEIDFYYSKKNKKFTQLYSDTGYIKPISLKERDENFFSRYDLFLSAHCKQLFPAELVNRHRCINIHPGYNPYNRGWFPQVFSIINGFPVGVTIHEMDTELDHGGIIYQQRVEVKEWDTSFDIYNRIMEMELVMIRDNWENILLGNYSVTAIEDCGNLNYKKDFDELCKLDIDNTATLKEHIDLLRALSFKGYDNAYYIIDGNKIYVDIRLKLGGVLRRTGVTNRNMFSQGAGVCA